MTSQAYMSTQLICINNVDWENCRMSVRVRGILLNQKVMDRYVKMI